MSKPDFSKILSHLKKPQPDYRRLENTLKHKGDSGNVPRLELFADPEIIADYLGEAIPATYGQVMDREALTKALDQKIRFWSELGYDAIWQGPVLDFPGMISLRSQDTAELSRPERTWVNENAGEITSWGQFERYPWPKSADVDYYPLEYLQKNMPEGMGILIGIPSVYEPVSWLMGYETLSLALFDQPDLVEAMFTRIREITLPVLRTCIQYDRVIGVWSGDDLGFKTGTLISPKHLRKYVFPVHKEMAEITYAAGLPYLLHSCGNLSSIMEDLINDVGIDGKHSFEDVIETVESFSEKYSQRIAVIGGVDLDLMTRGTQQQVRTRTRQILESCAPSCAYVLGSGNSIANYVPMANFLAMVDEGCRFNEENGR